MFDAELLARAVQRHREAYRIFRWLAAVPQALRRPQPRQEQALDSVENARKHLRATLEPLPPELHPDDESDAALDEVGAMLSTYLKTSFEFSDGWKADFVDECGCGWCSVYTRAIRRLQPMKLRPSERHHARELQIEVVRRCASEAGVERTEDEAQVALTDPNVRRSSALVAYGELLLERLRGETRGAEALVLWREFAWDGGAPRKDFTLDARDILDAERALRSRADAASP